MPLLEGCRLFAVEGISKKYGSATVLDNVSFSVGPGEIAAIVGKNGCGKSTLLAIAATLLRADSGAVLLDGRNPVADTSLRRNIGYVAQGDSLFDELSVGDNLRFWAGAAGIPEAAAADSPFAALLGLDKFWNKRVSRLSGGMRRRAAICAALLGDPQYVLLDEPFTGLDMLYRQHLSGFLHRLRERGKTIVYTTHSPQELAELSDFALLLSGGRIARREDTTASDGADLQKLFLSYIEGEESK